MRKKKRYKITANNIEFLMSNYIKALNIKHAKELFREKFDNGEICVNNSELIFQEIKREEAKCI